MSYEKDKLDSYVTSASLNTALAPYVTSNSLSAALAGIDLSPYVTSNSLSAAVATDVLTVRGAASVSATMSAAAVTLAGRPVGAVMLGYQALNNVSSVGFSGSWSDFAMLECRISYRAGSAGTATINVFTDGGTSAIMSAAFVPVASGAGIYSLDWNTWGGNGRGSPFTYYVIYSAGTGASSGGTTATANTSFVNCVRFTQSVTMSSGMAVLIGWRTS